MKKHTIIYFIFSLVVIVLMSLVVKGNQGNPIYNQTEKDKLLGGPFETTNSSSRYALVEAIVENNTFFFNETQAAFSAADIAAYNGKIFSIFTPGVSFVAVPFYILGKLIGMHQLFTYFSTILFALINLVLVAKLGRKLGASAYESLIGGMVFLFSTNALAYALSLTQHHISTTIILLGLINALSKRTVLNNFIFGLLYGAGLLMDIPNGLMMLPLALYIIYKHFSFSEISEKVKLSIKLNILALIFGLIPFVSVFAWYNYQLTGSYTKFSQSLGRVDYSPEGVVKRSKESGQKSFYEQGSYYNTRNQLNGLYTLLVSDERGWVYYSPIILVGILGLIVGLRKSSEAGSGSARKESPAQIVLGLSIALICFVSYASFGDPWGGWSFGPRYLIPASAMVCSGIGIAIRKFKFNPLFIIIFFVLTIYSISVNSLGAMTTSAIPPKVEAVNLTEPIPYSYKYNLMFVGENRSSALLYNIYLNKFFTFKDYLTLFIGTVVVIISALYLKVLLLKDKEVHYEKI